MTEGEALERVPVPVAGAAPVGAGALGAPGERRVADGSPLLSIRSLSIDYVGPRSVRAVDDLSLDLWPGEIFGLLGESGSGKSTAALGALRLLPPPAVIARGQVLFEGQDLLRASTKELQRLRFRRISVVMQSAMNALSPVLTVGEQIADVILAHEDVSSDAARQRGSDLLEQVGISATRWHDYPHQFSGGMKQRVAIAMALALRPSLVVLDEPTTALDVLVEREILQEVVRLQRELGFSVLIVSHDVQALLEVCDRLGVLYAGRLCEVASRAELRAGGRHPYTRALLESVPAFEAPRRPWQGISGAPPDPARPPSGCRFHPRCARRVDRCRTEQPALLAGAGGALLACHEPLALESATAAEGPSTRSDDGSVSGGSLAQARRPALLEVRHLTKAFARRGQGGPTTAVDDVSFQLGPGEVVAIVGQSGSGKSTILRILAGLEPPSSGEVLVRGQTVIDRHRRPALEFRRQVQIVLQDPFASLNPVHTVAHHLERALRLHGRIGDRGALEIRQGELLEDVGLGPASEFLKRRPHELSGGQRQRVAVARALAVQPDVILADEPTSMLDVSVRVGVLNLLAELKRERGLAYVYVTHDLSSARYLSDRILVLKAGRVVESGLTEQVLAAPTHPYTKQLVAAVEGAR